MIMAEKCLHRRGREVPVKQLGDIHGRLGHDLLNECQINTPVPLCLGPSAMPAGKKYAVVLAWALTGIRGCGVQKTALRSLQLHSLKRKIFLYRHSLR